MPLTDTKIRQAKAGTKPQKLTDGGGLYIEITTQGSKLWRYRYRIDGKENVFAVGAYPQMGLAEARRERDESKLLVKQGVHPAHHRRDQEHAASSARLNSFQSIADEWSAERIKKQHRSSAYLEGIRDALQKHAYPDIGRLPIKSVKPAHVLKIMKRLEAAGHESMAIKVRGWVSQVFSYAIIKDLTDNDPTYPLRNAIERPKTQHARPLSALEIADLSSRLTRYRGLPVTVKAIQFLMYAFPRQAELRGARVGQFDLKAGRWNVPAEIMKMRKPHIVPLSTQVIELLRELIPEDAKPDDLVFPGSDGKSPISRSTINAAMLHMGYAPKEITGHDFRATASTHLNELGYMSDYIERQMAHTEQNQVRASYNHAKHLKERTVMMQAWADYIDAIRSSDDKVIPILRSV